MKDEWRCPRCWSKKLQVCVKVWSRLLQSDDPSDDNFETEPVDNDHEWDGGSFMSCLVCRRSGIANDFYVGGPNAAWNNSEIQFPRLIAEIMANVEITQEQWRDLSDSMDLPEAKIMEIFGRAEAAWKLIKDNLPTT